MILQVPRQKRIRTRWCPSSLAKSVYNSNFTMVYGRLVGGFNPSEKYEFVIWDCYSQYLKKKGSKPPTSRYDIYIYIFTMVNKPTYNCGGTTLYSYPQWILDLQNVTPTHLQKNCLIISSFSCLCLKVGHPLIRSQNSLVTSTI